MKKLLMLVLIGLLLMLSLFIVLKGFTIGNIEILSFPEIRAKNQKLDETIQEASRLAKITKKQLIQ